MMTLDAVRDALLSERPWPRFDTLIRAELAAGRTTKEIYATLDGMADEVDDTTGLTDDGSDAFGDALDALTGMCHRDSRYIDPPDAARPAANGQPAFPGEVAPRVPDAGR